MVDLQRRPPPNDFSERIGLRVVRLMEACNVATFRLSEGKVGGSIFGLPVVLLTASGRTTGIRHVKPLLALPGSGSWAVIASRGGTRAHPEWYRNLESWIDGGVTAAGSALEPPTVEVAGMDAPAVVDASVLAGDERRAVWDEMVTVYGRFDAYQDRGIEREIPVVRLTPH